jgi:hypothetical protein
MSEDCHESNPVQESLISNPLAGLLTNEDIITLEVWDSRDSIDQYVTVQIGNDYKRIPRV